MALSSLFCADVPLRNYSLAYIRRTTADITLYRFEIWETLWVECIFRVYGGVSCHIISIGTPAHCSPRENRISTFRKKQPVNVWKDQSLPSIC